MTQVLIAVDDSESSIKTARTAYALFGDTATYTVVNVADQSPMIWGGDALVWGIGYPIVMAPSGAVEVEHARKTPSSDSAAAEVDSTPIDAAIEVARGVPARPRYRTHRSSARSGTLLRQSSRPLTTTKLT